MVQKAQFWGSGLGGYLWRVGKLVRASVQFEVPVLNMKIGFISSLKESQFAKCLFFLTVTRRTLANPFSTYSHTQNRFHGFTPSTGGLLRQERLSLFANTARKRSRLRDTPIQSRILGIITIVLFFL